LRLLLKVTSKTELASDYGKMHVLSAAIKTGDKEIIKQVLKHIDDVNVPLDPEGNTVAHLIAMYGQEHLLSMFLERDLDLIKINSHNLTAFDYIIRNDDHKFMKKLWRVVGTNNLFSKFLTKVIKEKKEDCYQAMIELATPQEIESLGTSYLIAAC
jgi:ankyrin repeat protein